MLLVKQEMREKTLRRAAARIAEIHLELAARPMTPLKNKIFVGHWRFFVVRRDVLRSSIGSQIQMVVSKCNHWVLGKRGIPSSYRSTTEVALSTREAVFSQGQGLRSLGRVEWEASSFPDFFKKKWFLNIPRIIRAGTKNIEVDRYFPQVPPRMIEFAYKPAYMTASRLPDGDLETELRHLCALMEKTHGWEKIQGRNVDEWDMSLRRLSLREEESKDEVRAWNSLDLQG